MQDFLRNFVNNADGMYGIQCNGSYTSMDWDTYIRILNRAANASYSGDSYEDYYGFKILNGVFMPILESPCNFEEGIKLDLEDIIQDYHELSDRQNDDDDDHYDDDDDDDDDDDYNEDYQKMERVFRFDLQKKPKFSIGFEIEKEDEEAHDCVRARFLYDKTEWIKENDGSLCDEIGYELVSPAFDLFSSKMEDEINESRTLQQLINADSSRKCGGHVNLGSSEYNSNQLLEGLSAFLPLLYAMYENRIEEYYAKAHSKHKYHEMQTKQSAVYVKSHVLEFRIFPAVKNVKNLLWRRDLMRIMCSNINSSEIDVVKMIANPKSKLHIHLRKIFTIDTMVKKIELFVKYSKMYNDKNIEKMSKVKNAIKKLKKLQSNGVNISNELGA